MLRCILFVGPLGSGKTTLTRGLVESLPGGDDAEVSSPSFNICNLYPTLPAVAHFDLYRLAGGEPDDALLDLLDEGTSLVLVEWAERLPEDAPPVDHLVLTWHPVADGRLIEAHAHGKAAQHTLLMAAEQVTDLVTP